MICILCDLHTHTTFSDGQYTPKELVEKAKAAGIEALAVTDHDTIDGVREAVVAGQTLGVRVIRGVELSAREYNVFHILGYGYSQDAPRLRELSGRMKERRDARAVIIIEYLREKNAPISLDEVLEIAGGDIIARPHFAQVLVKHGYAATNDEAFAKFLNTDDYHRAVKRNRIKKPTVRECIDAIKSDGGVVSLAHPYQIGLDNESLDELVGNLSDIGLDAIECRYPLYTPDMTEFYLGLAKKYHLHITGGSDFHGERVKPNIKLATLNMDIDWLLNS